MRPPRQRRSVGQRSGTSPEVSADFATHGLANESPRRVSVRGRANGLRRLDEPLLHVVLTACDLSTAVSFSGQRAGTAPASRVGVGRRRQIERGARVTPRWATFGAFFLNGAMIGTWVGQILFVQDRLDVSKATIGLALLCMASGAMVAMPLTGQILDRRSSATITRIAAPGVSPAARAAAVRSNTRLASVSV